MFPGGFIVIPAWGKVKLRFPFFGIVRQARQSESDYMEVRATAFRTERKRAKKGLQQTADYLGVSKQAVNSWERGKFEPNIGTIKKMSEYYGCSIEQLLAPGNTE